MQDALPKPFLQPIFDASATPFISAGFNYDSKEVATHGIKEHRAIDFEVSRGTVIYAPADGYYVSTYGEVMLADGSARMLGVKKARAANFYNDDINPPSDKGVWPIWFGGLFIQGWHKNGMYTQFGHLDFVDINIPYYPPAIDGNNLLYSEILKINPKQYKKSEVAVFIKAGTPIGKTGISGMGWGPRSYDFAEIKKDGRPDFSTAKYTYYNSPHLHFAVFSKRNEVTSEPEAYYDPFGIYGTLHASYPKRMSQWSKLKNSLWLGV